MQLVVTAILLLCPCLILATDTRSRCRDGDDWYYLNGNCYYWSNRTEGWFGAEKHCQQLGGHLVSIGSRPENSFLHAMAQCSVDFWIGLAKTDARQRGFAWWDDSRSNYTEMLSIRSQDYLDCVYFDAASNKWYNTYCQMLRNYVCMAPTPTVAVEGNEKPDGNADLQGSSKCPDDWLSLESSCFFVSSEKTNYFSAQMSCEAKGATVANVLSAREQTLLTMALGCNTEAWIGLEKVRPCISNPSQQFCWAWMDRTPLGYVAWHSGHPSITKEVECVISDGRWRSTNCYNEHRYICKKTKHSSNE